MKALLVSLLFPVLLKSCEGSYEQDNRPPQAARPNSNSNTGAGDNADDADATNVPIDGGLTILLAAGAAYGYKRYRGNRKKQQEQVGGKL